MIRYLILLFLISCSHSGELKRAYLEGYKDSLRKKCVKHELVCLDYASKLYEHYK